MKQEDNERFYYYINNIIYLLLLYVVCMCVAYIVYVVQRFIYARKVQAGVSDSK